MEIYLVTIVGFFKSYEFTALAVSEKDAIFQGWELTTDDDFIETVGRGMGRIEYVKATLQGEQTNR